MLPDGVLRRGSIWFDEDLLSAVRDRYRESNATVFRRYFGRDTAPFG